MFTFYPGQHIVARDGALYVLVAFTEGVWWAQPLAGATWPRPVDPLYPCWGDDDERGGADLAPFERAKRLRREARARRRAGRVRATNGVTGCGRS